MFVRELNHTALVDRKYGAAAVSMLVIVVY